MSERDELERKATAESIAHDAEQLARLERTKARLPADNRVIDVLTREASALADKIDDETAVEDAQS